MESVVFGFLGTVLLALLIVIIPTLILNFLLGVFRVICSLFRRGKREHFTDLQVVIGILIVSLVATFLLRLYLGFNNLKVLYIAILLTGCVIYTLTLIYILSVDIKAGKEGRIEQGVLLALIFIFASIISLIWEPLVNVGPLGIVGTVATLFAGTVALFSLTISFLNYKRKSGVAIDCSLVMLSKVPHLVFINLKDRPVVIYDVLIKFKNLEVKGVLDEYKTLSPYGIEYVKLDESFYLSGERKGLPVILDANFITLSLLITQSTKVSAMTNLGEVDICYKPTKLLSNKEADLSLTLFRNKEKGLLKKDTYLAFDGDAWEVVMSDDVRLEPVEKSFGDIRYLKSSRNVN